MKKESGIHKFLEIDNGADTLTVKKSLVISNEHELLDLIFYLIRLWQTLRRNND